MKKISEFSRREKIYLVVIIVLLVLLIVKSVWVDPAICINASEMNFSYWVNNTAIPEEFGDGFFSRYIVVSRLVKISEKKDESGNDIYVGKIRRYLFGFLPVQERKLATLKSAFD